jgi:hypothetical protein
MQFAQINKRLKWVVILVVLAVAAIGVAFTVSLLPTHYTADDFENALRYEGAIVEILPESTNLVNVFPVSAAYRIKVNGERLDTYEFENDSQTLRVVRAIEPGGSGILGGEGIKGLMIDWVMRPHWYRKGQLVVLYVGDTRKMLVLLEKLLGSEFASPPK